jgi:hypothetical protein
MNQIDRRIDALEAQLRPWGAPSQQADREFVSQSPLLVALAEIARLRAERRWCFDHNRPTHNAEDPARFLSLTRHGWIAHTTEEAKDELTLAEIADLDRRIAAAAYPRPAPLVFAVIEAWCDDDTGLAPWWRPVGAAHFRKVLAGQQWHIGHARTTTPIGQEWCRQHPAWRPDLSPDELARWEVEYLASLAQ